MIGSSFVIGRENCASFLTNLRMLLSQANAILDHCLVFLCFTWDLRGNSTFIFVSYTTDCPALTSQEWSTKISDFERVYLYHPMHLQIVRNTLTNFLCLDFKPAQGKISERPRKQVKSATSRLLHRLFILFGFCLSRRKWRHNDFLEISACSNSYPGSSLPLTPSKEPSFSVQEERFKGRKLVKPSR